MPRKTIKQLENELNKLQKELEQERGFKDEVKRIICENTAFDPWRIAMAVPFNEIQEIVNLVAYKKNAAALMQGMQEDNKRLFYLLRVNANDPTLTMEKVKTSEKHSDDPEV